MPPGADPLSRLGFITLDPQVNRNILPYMPLISAPALPSPADPKLIILATWVGGASPSRIAVYCKAYQSLDPSARILLIRAALSDFTTKTCATLQAQLTPARDYVLSIFPPGLIDGMDAPSSPARQALLHLFSHGGCNTALQLSRSLRNESSSSTLTGIASMPFPIPLVGIVLDSCPGSQSFDKAYCAAACSLPHGQPANLFGRVVLYPLIGTISSLQTWGVLSSVEDLRQELNDLSTFGDAPRLYLHSKGDKVVATEDVASHAKEIAAKGTSVSRQVWEFAEHCALPVEDSARYWNAVRDFVADQTSTRVAAKL